MLINKVRVVRIVLRVLGVLIVCCVLDRVS